MQREYIKCKCNNIYTDSDFILHSPKCNEFKIKFRQFDNEFGRLLKTFSEPKENLLIIRVLLDQYRNVFDSKIKNAGISFAHKSNGIYSLKTVIIQINRDYDHLGEGQNNKKANNINIININEDIYNHNPNKIDFNPRSDDIRMVRIY